MRSLRGDGDAALRAAGDVGGDGAADGGDVAFEVAHAGFAGVARR